MKFFSSFAAKRPVCLLGGVVFGIALLVQAVLGADYYLHSPFYSGLICDSRVYYKWASAIFAGDLFGQEIFHQAPLYPYFIAALWLVSGQHYLAIYAAQALMTATSALLVFLISRQLFNNYTGLAAGLLCAFYSTLNFYALKILPDTLGVLLHLCLAYLLLNAKSARQWLLAGCAGGLLIVARPHALLLLPMILLWLIFARENTATFRQSVTAGLKQYALFILPVFILVGLVALRNYMIEPDLVLVSSNGGENFYMGNNPKADGIYCRLEGITPDIEHQKADVKKAAETKLQRTLTSAKVSDYWRSQGVAFIRDNFHKYLRLETVKLRRIFSGTEYTNMYFLWFERAEFTKTLLIPAVHFYLILPLAVIGAVLLAGQWRKYGILYIMIGLTVLNMMIFYVDERYRLPMIPFLIILGAGGVYRMLEIFRNRPGLQLVKIGLFALVISALAITFHLYRTEPARLAVEPQLYYNLGEVYFKKTEYRAALDMFDKSSRLAGDNWPALIGAGKALFALGKKEPAAQLYREAFPKLEKDLQTSFLRDRDLDGLREYLAAQAPK